MDQDKSLELARSFIATKSNAEAVEIFESLILLGNASAMNDLGVFLIKSNGSDPAAIERATSLLYSAIENGNTSALLNLAQLRRRQHRRDEAATLFNEALYMGHLRASQFLLEGIPQPIHNMQKMMEWISENRSPHAMHQLARDFRIKKKFMNAEYWFLKTCQTGLPRAAEELAEMYRQDMRDEVKFKDLVTKLRTDTPYLGHLLQGQILADNDENLKALVEFKAALEIDSRSTVALRKIQNCYRKLKDLHTFEHWILDVSNKAKWPLLRNISAEYISRKQMQQSEYWHRLWLKTQDIVKEAKNELATQENSNHKKSDHNKSEPQATIQMEVRETVTKTNQSESRRPEARTTHNSSVEANATETKSDALDTEYEEWVELGRAHTSATFISKNSLFLKKIFQLKMEYCPLIGNWMQSDVTEEWLEEIFARYEEQKPIQKLDPIWPIRFESPDLQIILSVEGMWLRAWVGRDNMGGIIAIRLNNFEICTALTDEDRIFAIGVAVSFFLDQTINLERTNHPHFSYGSDGTVNPTSTFELDIEKTRNGQRQVTKSYLVSGHVRTLPEGSMPNSEALTRAPIYVRRNLKPGQTFVRGHQRNGPVIHEQVLRYLRTNSNLADAVGAIDRH
jgi:hypothetical protein